MIGTCTFFQAIPLIILSKGKSDKSKEKFFALADEEEVENPDIFLSNNQNGWTNEEVMLHYLQYLHDNYAPHGYALILDCLPAHRTLAVIQKANELQIELIFVPANGIGLYNPLDRKIFCILKAKLRSLTGCEALSGKNRHRIITRNLMRCSQEVNFCDYRICLCINELVSEM